MDSDSGERSMDEDDTREPSSARSKPTGEPSALTSDNDRHGKDTYHTSADRGHGYRREGSHSSGSHVGDRGGRNNKDDHTNNTGRETRFGGGDRRRQDGAAHLNNTQNKPPLNIAHTETCPVLLRSFLADEKPHDLRDFAGGKTPSNEFLLHAWRDLSMSRFAELLRAKRPETRNKELVFAVIYAEPKSGSWRSRDIGRVFVRRPGQVDNVTLHDLSYMNGDYISITLVTPDLPRRGRTGGPERSIQTSHRRHDRAEHGERGSDRREQSTRQERSDYYRDSNPRRDDHRDRNFGSRSERDRGRDRDDFRGDSRRFDRHERGSYNRSSDRRW